MDTRRIPLSSAQIVDEDVAAVVRALRSGRVAMGPEIRGFEEELAAVAGVRHAVACSSGTAALHMALLALGVGEGDVVLTTPFSFVASSNVILMVGAVPVFVDIDPDTLCPSPEELRRTIGALRRGEFRFPHGAPVPPDRLKALLLVDVFGLPAPWEQYEALAREEGLVLLEDSCEALGSRAFGRACGSFGRAGAFAFYPNKQITTGEGGMVVTESDDYADRLRRFRSHGIVKDPKQFLRPAPGPWHTEMQHLGYNYRLSDIQCALGASQMERLDLFLARRKQLAQWYGELLVGVPHVRPAPDHPGHAWHIYPLWVEPALRRQVFEGLREREIGVQVHYPLVSSHPYYVDRYGPQKGSFPEAERISEGEISLPMFPAMEDGDVDRVVDALQCILESVAP